MNPSWLNDGMMNLLVDYYPEVPFRPYGSGATRDNVVPFLRQLDLGYLCIYAKGHSGYTTWRSSLGTRHVMLASDMPAAFRAYTREAGTRLVLYFSGLLDGIAGLRHPDWRMRHPDGSFKDSFPAFNHLMGYGICPLSPFFDEWVAIQLRELLETAEPDGIWVDGDWPGPCYCPRCQARFRADSGWTGSWSDMIRRPDFDTAYAPTWNRIEHEWRLRFSGFIKTVRPNCVYSAGNVSARREFAAPFDWRSGDFFSPGFHHLHDMARMMRWYGTLEVPYDAYVCDTSFTHERQSVRSRTKTLDRMLQEAATVAAAGGQVGYWTYPLGNGAWVPSRMRKAIAVRRFLKQRETLFRGSSSARWTAIVVSDPTLPKFGGNSVEGAHKALAALHRSPDILDETGLTSKLPYDLLVIPEQAVLAAAAVRRLAAFVRAGGKLLTSGASIRSPELRALLDIQAVGEGAWPDGHVRLRGHDEPTGIDSAWDRLSLGPGAEELYPLYRSWDQDNPEARHLANNWPMHGQMDEERPETAGGPAAILRRLGKGCIVHVATDIFSQYRVLGDPQILRWLRELVDILQPAPLCATDAPSWVDLSLRIAADGRLLIHFVNQNPGRDLSRLGTWDLWADEIPEVGPYTLSLRLARPVRSATWEPGGKTLRCEAGNNGIRIRVPRFRVHGCVSIET